MIPYWHDAFLTVYEGDCREVMAQMEPESVHCVVTSPPYWGLRDYGTATWIGGDDGCDHQNGALASDKSTLAGYTSENIKLRTNGMPYRSECRKCGAVRQDSQLGLEPTPEQYVENMVAVFREVRRVLRKDGTCWVNLGDSYAAGTSGRNDGYNPTRANGSTTHKPMTGTPRALVDGLKPKDLVGIPWRVAFALQADGWYLRSDIIWSKPNPMPESVTDRPTKAHEYLFLLTKSPRYFYDAEAVREPDSGLASGNGFNGRMGGDRQTAVEGGNGSPERFVPGSGRNLRTVWTIATQPYPGAHFATFPEALVEPCVKAGTSERGVCPECGAPWAREVEKPSNPDGIMGKGNGRHLHDFNGTAVGVHVDPPNVVTLGWRPSCQHTVIRRSETLASGPLPATVLDPFAGSGTTGRVAQRLGRRAVLIDLSGEYLKQLMVRNADIPLGLAEGSGR